MKVFCYVVLKNDTFCKSLFFKQTKYNFFYIVWLKEKEQMANALNGKLV